MLNKKKCQKTKRSACESGDWCDKDNGQTGTDRNQGAHEKQTNKTTRNRWKQNLASRHEINKRHRETRKTWNKMKHVQSNTKVHQCIEDDRIELWRYEPWPRRQWSAAETPNWLKVWIIAPFPWKYCWAIFGDTCWTTAVGWRKVWATGGPLLWAMLDKVTLWPPGKLGTAPLSATGSLGGLAGTAVHCRPIKWWVSNDIYEQKRYRDPPWNI